VNELQGAWPSTGATRTTRTSRDGRLRARDISQPYCRHSPHGREAVAAYGLVITCSGRYADTGNGEGSESVRAEWNRH